MPDTPLNAGARISFDILSTISHVHNVLCDALFTGGSWQLVEHLGGNQAPATFAAAWANLIKPFYPLDAVIEQWRLQTYSGGAYTEVASGSLAVSGTNASPDTGAGEYTFTFRDETGHKVHFRLIGTIIGAGGEKKQAGAYGGVVLALSNAVITGAAGTPHQVVRGRSGDPVTIPLSYVTSLNRKARRRLGLV